MPLYPGLADATHAGLVSTATQSFGGLKTFVAGLALPAAQTAAFANTAELTIRDAANTKDMRAVYSGDADLHFGSMVLAASSTDTWLQAGRNILLAAAATTYARLISARASIVFGHNIAATAATSSLFSFCLENEYRFEGFDSTNTTPYNFVRVTASNVVTFGDAAAATDVQASTRIYLNGGQRWRYTVPGAYPYAATNANAWIAVNATAAARTVNLPTAASVGTGGVLWVSDDKGQATANNITVTPSGAETINGVAASVVLTKAYTAYMLVSDGTSNWSAFTLS